MISRKALIISPLVSIGAVSALLVGAAAYFSFSEPPPPIVYEEFNYDCHGAYEAPPAPQDLGPLAVENFPHYFQGYFHWDGETRADQQNVGLDVHDVGINEHGLIVATGRATYNTNFRNIDFTFRIEVNPDTNEFVMWESDPNKSGFVTTGRHEATIATFQNIDATWIGDDGDRGVLKLWPAEGSMRFFSEDVGADAPRRAPQHMGNSVYMQKGTTTGLNCVEHDRQSISVAWAGRASNGHFMNYDSVDTMPDNMIPGLELALLDMCEGETARVFVPTDMAYADGSEFDFAPGGHVMFDVRVR